MNKQWYRSGLRTALVMAGALVVALQPALGAETIFQGSGTVGTVGRAPGTALSGTVASGDTLTFGLIFDTAGAPRIFDGGASAQVFAPAVRNFSATVGGYSFALNTASAAPLAIVLGTGFSFFGGSGSEPALIQQFSFSGLPTGNLPFALSSTARANLSLTSFFRQDLGGALPTLVDLRDPGFAARNEFAFNFFEGNRAVGSVRGNFSGSFAAIAGVPEPSTWALLILGFGATGGAMRRRRPRARLSYR